MSAREVNFMEVPVRLPVALLIMVLAAGALCYVPGLTGGFILDDAGSLMQLGVTGSIKSLAELREYVFGGIAGPGGRPLALLTFAMNAQTWPTNPFPFLATNVGIHILNGVLIFALLRKMLNGNVKFPARVTHYLPVVATAIWLLHPIHLSAVLYIVQRMATLAVTFTLLTLVVYLEFRKAYVQGDVRRCWNLALGGVVLFFLGYFTKETILLLPAQVLVVELFVGAIFGDSHLSSVKKLRNYLVYPAATAFFAYPLWLLVRNIAYFWQFGAEPMTGRSFTMFERLLTEGRILGDYVWAIIIPRSQSAGVFYDGYSISNSLFSPQTTFYWWSIHVALIVGAVRFRVRYPLICFGVLWFYVNHVLESTIFMLELKFEHRNYLAVLGWAVLSGYGLLAINVSTLYRRALVSAYLCLLAALLFLGAKLWGDPAQSSLVWAENNPDSPRALDYAASIFIAKPETAPLALSLIERAAKLTAADPTFEIKYLWYSCGSHAVGSVDWASIAKRLQVSPLNWSLHATLRNLLESAGEGRCPELGFTDYISMIAAVRQNPNYANTSVPVRLAEEEVLAGFVLGRPDKGLAVYMAQDFSKVPLSVMAQQTLVVASHGYRQEAVTYFEKSLAMLRNDPALSAFALSQFEEILQLIKSDIAKYPAKEGE